MRIVTRKQQLVYDVRDFGAVGDGVTDDATAISAALTAGAGAVVFIPEGTYGVGSAIAVPANTHLMGASISTTKLLRLSTYAGSVLTVNGDYSRCSDLTVDANIDTLVTTTGLINTFGSSEVEIGGTYARLDRVRILEPLHMGVGMLGHDVTVADCVIVGAADGDLTRTITGNTQASPTVVTTSSNHGFVTGQYVSITGSNSNGSIDGTKYVSVLSPTTFSLYSDSGLTSPVAVATAAGTAGTVATDQGPSRYGIYNADSSSYRNVIERCRVTKCYWGAVYLGGEDHIVRDNIFWNNHHMSTLTGGGQIALTVPGDGRHRIQNNTILCDASHPGSSVNTSGVEVTAPYTLVSGNTIHGNTLYGVILQGTDANNSQVVGNQVLDNGDAGILAGGAVKDFLISGNESGNSAGSTAQNYGIRVTSEASDRYLVVGNRCYLNATHNIYDEGTGSYKQFGPNMSGAVTGMTINESRASHAEAAYTPASNVTAHASATGRYTKIGRLVFCEFLVQFGSGGGGDAARIGLPFTAGTDGAGVVGACTETTAQALKIQSGTNYMTVYTNADTAKTEAQMDSGYLTGCAMFTV